MTVGFVAYHDRKNFLIPPFFRYFCNTLFLLSFFIKKIGPHFVVKLGSKSKEIRIHEDRRSDLAPFYDAVYVQIMNFFTQRYQEAITIGLKEPGFIMLSPKSSNL